MQLLVFGESLENAGAIRPSSLWEDEWGRISTSILLHGHWLHLLLNMLSLFLVGRVLEPAIGRGAYLFFLFACAVGGVAASLAWNDEEIYRVGISGGIAGLIGLVLALEWSITRSFGEFLKQRNTIVVLVLLVINAAYAVWVGQIGGAPLDHAGHVGGLALGLLAGLGYYTRRGVRPARGVAVALVLVLPALAYARYPFRSMRFHTYRYDHAENDEERIDALRAILGLDPSHAAAAAQLARLLDDPAPLRKLGVPARASEASAVVGAWLDLAARRLEDDPDAARAFASEAAEIRHAASTSWLRFGTQAEEAGHAELANEAYVRAYDAMKALGREADLWRPALARLHLLRKEQPDLSDPAAFEERLALAIEAAPAEGEARELLFAVLADAERAMQAADGAVQKRMARQLSALYAEVAESEPEGSEKTARLDLRMAVLFWGGAEVPSDPETLEMAAGRFETALRTARRTGDEEVAGIAEAWLRSRGFPLPERELEDGDDGG